MRKNKKLVERTLPTMVTPEEAVVRFTTNLLALTLPTMPAEENILAEPTSVASTRYLPTPNSPGRITMQTPDSKTGTLLEITTAPPSSLTKGLVSTCMI